MATKAEVFKTQQMRNARPPKAKKPARPRRDTVVDTSLPGVSASDRKVGGGGTAGRNKSKRAAAKVERDSRTRRRVRRPASQPVAARAAPRGRRTCARAPCARHRLRRPELARRKQRERLACARSSRVHSDCVWSPLRVLMNGDERAMVLGLSAPAGDAAGDYSTLLLIAPGEDFDSG